MSQIPPKKPGADHVSHSKKPQEEAEKPSRIEKGQMSPSPRLKGAKGSINPRKIGKPLLERTAHLGSRDKDNA